MTGKALVLGALAVALVTDAAPWVIVLGGAGAAFVWLYPVIARKVRARRAGTTA